MNTGPGGNEGEASNQEPTQPPEPSTVSRAQDKSGTRDYKKQAAEKPADIQDSPTKPPSWFSPDRVQAISAAVQAICAAALVYLTLQIRDITNTYSGYTQAQATAEATSASAAKKSADAEATSAANETRTLNDEEGQTKAEATNFSEQLSRLDASIRAANDLATSAKRNAEIAKENLTSNEDEFAKEQRAYVWVQIKYGPDYNGGKVRLDVQLVNFGKSPAIGVHWRHHLSVFTNDTVPVSQRIAAAYAAVPKPISGYVSFIPPTGQANEWQTDQSGVLTTAQMSYVQKSQFGWVEAGFVTYTDASGKPHYTKYCWPYMPGGAQHECGGNSQVK